MSQFQEYVWDVLNQLMSKLVFWIPGIPLWKGLLLLGTRFESQTTNPNFQTTNFSLYLGGGFQHVLFSPLLWGNDPIWRAYFSDGLTPPPRYSWLKPPTWYSFVPNISGTGAWGLPRGCITRNPRNGYEAPCFLGLFFLGGMDVDHTTGQIISATSHEFISPHPKRWLRKGNSLISGKSRLVKYYY